MLNGQIRMDIALGLGAAFGLLLLSVVRGVALGWPLSGAIALFLLIHLRRGQQLKSLLRYCWQGASQSWSVFSILLLIGALMSSWLAAGTVPALVYYGIQLIHPRYFVLSAFVLTGLVSSLLGTSFGAAGTMGLALMIIARSGGAENLNLVAGAIIAGAYVGDRCSPLSSSAHLIATVTGSPIYPNLRAMLLTAWVPLGLTLVAYGALSWRYPLAASGEKAGAIAQQIAASFQLTGLELLPAVLLLGLAVCQINVKLALLSGWGAAAAVAIGLQHYTVGELLSFTCWGFRLSSQTALDQMLLGGGLWPMGRVCAVVFLSTALAGLLAGTQSLQGAGLWLKKLRSQRSVFAGTALTSLVSAAFGCTQTIAIVLTHRLVAPQYGQRSGQLAVDLENTAVVLSPLIPWNIAGLVPATLLMSGPGFIPYAIYLYLVPLCNWAWPGAADPIKLTQRPVRL